MFSKVSTCGLIGLNGFKIDVETDISNGIPSFEIVGLADTSVKEARERVRAAIKNSGVEFPVKRITVNLAPADTRKEGAGFDLPLAVGILAAAQVIPQDAANGYLLAGELALDGSIRPVPGMLCKAITAKELQIRRLIIPAQNVAEVSIVKGLEIFPVNSLIEVIEHFKGITPIPSAAYELYTQQKPDRFKLDFSDVKGQHNAKRALEVAASGGHNVMMIGSPGSGKTMLARRLPSILPDMTFEESLEVTKIYSVAGMLPTGAPLLSERPFRSPHHTMSSTSLVGGGRIPKPGEVSLSHHGVLFLDEVPEFGRMTLDILRQPMEDGFACISRINATVTYPCKFMMVAAANPCKCGFLGDPAKACTCSHKDAQGYLSRLSGPLMDRIDLQVQVPTIKYADMEKENVEECSDIIRRRVNKTRRIQLERYKDQSVFCNAHLSGSMVKNFCKVDHEGRNLMRAAFEKLGLSARAHDRILKVARTIADMDECEMIGFKHIAEAIEYRSLDRVFKAF